jgi:hypothetical protein
MTIYSSPTDAKVGIGTQTPTYKLDVVSSSGPAMQAVSTATSGTNYGIVGQAVGSGASYNTGGYFTASGATNNNMGVRIVGPAAGTGNFALYSDATAPVYLAGRLGIGTTTPYAPLEVAVPGAGVNDVVLGQYLGRRTTGTAAAGMGVSSGFYLQDAGGSLIETNRISSSWIDASAGNRYARMDFYSARNNSTAVAMSIDHTGRVGIGTTSPQNTLELSNPTFTPSFRMAALGQNGYVFETTGTPNYNLRISYKNPTSVYADIMTFNYGGNVGIGTTAPQYRLAVNGTIGTKEVVVTNTGWADHVLKPEYRLKPLDRIGVTSFL